MPFIPGVNHVVLKWTAEGEIAMAGFWVLNDTPGTPLTTAQLGSLSTLVDDYWNTGSGGGTTAQKASHPSQVIYRGVSITSYTTSGSNGSPITTNWVDSIAATAGSGTLPAQVALCLTTRTALATRRGRGRFYLPWLSSSFFLEPSTFAVDPANGNQVGANLAGLFTAINASAVPVTAVVFSFVDGVGRAITAVDNSNQFDTQRRRAEDLADVYNTTGV